MNNKVQLNVDLASSRDMCYIRIMSDGPLSDVAIADLLQALVNKIKEGETNEQPTETADPGTSSSDKV